MCICSKLKKCVDFLTRAQKWNGANKEYQIDNNNGTARVKNAVK